MSDNCVCPTMAMEGIQPLGLESISGYEKKVDMIDTQYRLCSKKALVPEAFVVLSVLLLVIIMLFIANVPILVLIR